MTNMRIRRPALIAGSLALVMFLSFGYFGARSSIHRANAAGQYLSGDHLVVKNARDVDLKARTVVVPIHRGVANGKTVWYIITDASDYGVAHDLNALYAPKLAHVEQRPDKDPAENVFNR